MIKQSINLFINDLKQIVTNKFAMVIFVGLMLLPSFYAWFNIWALQDPYGNASNLPIAILSEDVGVKVDGQYVNVGDEVKNALKENEDLNWQFPQTRKELDDSVNVGDYYGAIVIPSNFSEQMMGFTNGSYKKPKLEYIVNEKVNAIAPKMTEAGAEAIYSEITTGFNLVVNTVVLDNASKLGIDLSERKDKLQDAVSDLNTANNAIPQILAMLDELDNINNELKYVNNSIPAVKAKLETGQNGAVKVLDEAKTQVSAINIDENSATSIEDTVKKYNAVASKLNENQITDSQVSSVANVVSQINEFSDKSTNALEKIDNVDTAQIDKANESLQNIAAKLEKFGMSDEAQKLRQITSTLTDVKGKVEYLQGIDVNGVDIDEESASNIISNAAEISKITLPLISEEKIPSLSEVRTFKQSVLDQIDDSREIISSIDPNKLDDLSNELALASGRIESAIYYRDNYIEPMTIKFSELTAAVNEFANSGEYENLIEILSFDISKLSDFLTSPVEMETTRLYPVKNYGMASTPFYTSLCLWVGGLLLASLLSFESHKLKVSNRSQYLGRLLTFVFIGVIQSIIVSLGDVLLLGIEPANLVLFMITNIFVAITFVTILYTLVAIFGNIGKAIGIVILVLSISGGGGNFPIEVSGQFFQDIYPYLPFTYAVKLMRETIAGVYLPTLIECIKVLSVYLLSSIIFGLITCTNLKLHFDKFDKKAKDSGLLH